MTRNDMGIASYNLFLDEMEREAITRIQKFAKIASAMEYEIGVGFSGGKDSLVVYDLCKRAGIACKFYFNHALEDIKTLRYIRENFPDVIWRRTLKGFFEYIVREKKMLPTVTYAWCCEMYKHPSNNVDDASILGVRASESAKRKDRKVFESKNKTFKKRNKAVIDEYFEDRCQGVGAPNKISLKPIVDWIIMTDDIDYSNDKVYYVCRWLNHSFMPFSKRQEKLYNKFRKFYNTIKK